MLAGIFASRFVTNLCGWIAGGEKTQKEGEASASHLCQNKGVRAMFDLLRLIKYRFSFSGYIAYLL
jgi:hypothetical protein